MIRDLAREVYNGYLTLSNTGEGYCITLEERIIPSAIDYVMCNTREELRCNLQYLKEGYALLGDIVTKI